MAWMDMLPGRSRMKNLITVASSWTFGALILYKRNTCLENKIQGGKRSNRVPYNVLEC